MRKLQTIQNSHKNYNISFDSGYPNYSEEDKSTCSVSLLNLFGQSKFIVWRALVVCVACTHRTCASNLRGLVGTERVKSKNWWNWITYEIRSNGKSERLDHSTWQNARPRVAKTRARPEIGARARHARARCRARGGRARDHGPRFLAFLVPYLQEKFIKMKEKNSEFFQRSKAKNL